MNDVQRIIAISLMWRIMNLVSITSVITWLSTKNSWYSAVWNMHLSMRLTQFWSMKREHRLSFPDRVESQPDFTKHVMFWQDSWREVKQAGNSLRWTPLWEKRSKRPETSLSMKKKRISTWPKRVWRRLRSSSILRTLLTRRTWRSSTTSFWHCVHIIWCSVTRIM